LISGVVLICVFVLTLVFGIVRIINTAPQRTIPRQVTLDVDESLDAAKVTSTSDKYALGEDVIKLIIELVFILFAILATFILHRYVKSKYDSVPTTEEKK